MAWLGWGGPSQNCLDISPLGPFALPAEPQELLQGKPPHPKIL